MQDSDEYAYYGRQSEEVDPHPEKEHLAGIEIQTTKYHSLCDTLWEHTVFLRGFYFLLLALTVYQFLDAWQGDMWVLPSFDAWHEHMQWIVEIHMTLTEHNETLHEVARSYQRSLPWLEEPALFHPDSISRIVASHWQTPLVLFVLYVNGLIAASVVGRKIFLYTYKRYTGIVLLYSLCLLSFIGQLVAVFVRAYVFVFFPTFYGGLALFVNLICLLPELLSAIDLYKMRSTIMWMSMHYERLNDNVRRQQPGDEGEQHVSDIMQESRPWKDSITEFLSTSIEKSSPSSTLRRRKASRRQDNY